jgi:hypothetical protein
MSSSSGIGSSVMRAPASESFLRAGAEARADGVVPLGQQQALLHAEAAGRRPSRA